MTAIFLFVTLILLLVLGVPAAFTLGLASALSILLFSDVSLASISLKLFESVSSHYTLLAIPFFILASHFLSSGGVAKRMIDFSISAVGHLRGGLAIACVFACMLFAAVSGSSPATVAAIGSLIFAAMKRAKYPESMAIGVITNAGTLGILIPPSIVMIVYAISTEVSVAKMFMAGVVPGIMIGLGLMVAVYIYAHIKKLPSQKFGGFKTLGINTFKASGGLLLIFIILFLIYGGVASPTEAAAISAVYAFFISVFFYRDIGPLKNTPWILKNESLLKCVVRNLSYFITTWHKLCFDKQLRTVLSDATKMSVMLLFIIANAMLFAHVLTTEQIPHAIANWISGLGVEAWLFLIIVNVLLILAGDFMEPSAILLITAPIFLPIATELGIDPIHLGIIMVINMEIGMITPPIGLNLFVATGNYWKRLCLGNEVIFAVVKLATVIFDYRNLYSANITIFAKSTQPIRIRSF